MSETEEVVYCPKCLEERGEKVELECWTEWKNRDLVPVFWSKLAMLVVEQCSRCGYRNEYDADELPETSKEDGN